MIRTRRAQASEWLIAVLLVIAGSGCVDARLTANVLEDGSGNIEFDVGYDTATWPSFLGDPLSSYTSRAQLRGWTSPGVIAWSKPQIVREGRHRRLRTALWFDDLSRVEFWATRKGKPFETLGFWFRGEERVTELRAGFAELLDRPLPLPSPGRVGMDVALSPDLLAAVRRQIRPVIEGLHLQLDVVLPGEVSRADGFRSWEGHTASLGVDADLLARAMNERAGVLFEEETLERQPPQIEWQEPKEADSRRVDLTRRRAAAMAWWQGDGP